MRIKTYILLPKGKLTTEEKIEKFIEIIYQTIIPVLGAYGFLTTTNPLFLSLIVLPIFIRFKVEPIQTRIYKEQIKKNREKTR